MVVSSPFSIFLMRLDVYLKLSRLVPRRSLAQEFCDSQMVEVNGGEAKSSKEIKIGDLITIRRRDRITKISVTAIPETKQVSKNISDLLYEVISEEITHR